MAVDRWLLPEGVEETLPPRAAAVEQARRRVLDLFSLWGYELVRTPFFEHRDALLTGAGAALELQTFTLIDQLSGRQLGLRADMTPQVARIDAHSLPKPGTARYCYIGSVLRTRPDSLGGNRAPLQVGAELFGSNASGADVEVISLMLSTLDQLGVGDIHLDLGHVGIYRALIASLGLGAEAEARLFDIVQCKSLPDLREFVQHYQLDPQHAMQLEQLINANGALNTLDDAALSLGQAQPQILAALEELKTISARIARDFPAVIQNIDLAELRGYRYKTGVVFSVYQGGSAKELARGGRYDGVGKAFGRARPATGFSADLNVLVSAMPPVTATTTGIYAPDSDDAALYEQIAALRSQGQRVVLGYPGDSAALHGCSEQLSLVDGLWRVTPIR